ncbi:cytokine-induced anti-apoptosis inhibitor 1, Fe-S biogenesis-domain-containing protein [Blastocladiella britannica]|nr:cytokine-induced anti-apoptosis inhibitor 1, Fe-S biogenesis-domain-containing protein [Blastocladiella britannica]
MEAQFNLTSASSVLTPLGLPAKIGAPAPSILVLSNAYAPVANIELVINAVRDAVAPTNGTVALEQLDRLDSIHLKPASYSHIISGFCSPLVPHTTHVLGKLVTALSPGGVLLLREVGVIDGGDASNSALADLRSASLLATRLKLTGLIGASTSSTALDPEVCASIAGVWGASDNLRDLALLEVRAEKPSYEVGAIAALPLGLRNKKKKASLPGSAATAAVTAVSLWSAAPLSGDVIDESSLLDDKDLERPSAALLSRPSNCETRRKACKTCTCGRAEMEMLEPTERVVVDAAEEHPIANIVPSTTKSSCGNCYLGDAFRCASCPYLGMPAFKPGEQVTLSGVIADDDVAF